MMCTVNEHFDNPLCLCKSLEMQANYTKITRKGGTAAGVAEHKFLQRFMKLELPFRHANGNVKWAI